MIGLLTAMTLATRRFGVTGDAIISGSREAPIVRARHMMIQTLYRYGWSKWRIAEALDLNHKSVQYAVEKGELRAS